MLNDDRKFKYYRVRMKTGSGTRIAWAMLEKETETRYLFKVIDKEGQFGKIIAQDQATGLPVEQIEYILGDKSDFVYVRKAEMNKHYGELEVVK